MVDVLQDGDTALIIAVTIYENAVDLVSVLLKHKNIDVNARNQVSMGQYQANRVQRAGVGVIRHWSLLGPWRVPHAWHDEWLMCCRMATLR